MDICQINFIDPKNNNDDAGCIRRPNQINNNCLTENT